MRAAEIEARLLVIESGEHDLVGGARAVVQQQDGRVVVEPQLPEGAALGDAGEAERCAAWVHGSVPFGWYFAPHRPKSLPKAPSVSVSAACCVSSCASCGAVRSEAARRGGRHRGTGIVRVSDGVASPARVAALTSPGCEAPPASPARAASAAAAAASRARALQG